MSGIMMSTARWTTGHPLSGDAATRDCVLLALEAVERGDGAKGLLLGDDHVGRHIGQDRRLEEAAALGGALAAGDHLGALLQRVGDVRLDLLDRLHVDQRPDHRTRLEPRGAMGFRPLRARNYWRRRERFGDFTAASLLTCGKTRDPKAT